MGRENKNIILLLITFPLIFIATSEGMIPAGFFVVFIDEYIPMKVFAVAGILSLLLAIMVPGIIIARSLLIFALLSLIICWSYCFTYSENKLITAWTSLPFFYFIYRLVIKRLIKKIKWKD